MMKMDFSGWCIMVLAACVAFPLRASDDGRAVLSSRARITVLTCTPGPDLYSIFGHSAIRVEDLQGDRMVDEVYNYGTFVFDDQFYYKFVKGHLDYTLSRTDFGTFQQEYLYTGRGITEQELRLDSADRQRLYDALIENYKPENRIYRYDYFFDNCSSRIGEIIRKSVSGDVRFTYVSAEPYTYRDAIDRYLVHMPWSDFGIDLALGIPCDEVMDRGQDMFLPDSLLKELNLATYRQRGLVSRPMEVIPQEFYPRAGTVGTPMQVMLLMLLVQVIAFRITSGRLLVTIVDRIILLLTGLAGLLLLFLWLGTDHHAAAWNLNLLWASPLNLIMAFLPASLLLRAGRRYFSWYAAALVILLGGWVFFPQNLHEALLPMVASLGWICLRLILAPRSSPIAEP